MGYAWSETIAESTDVERDDIEEIRTNVNTERVDRAGLGAYDWTTDSLQGTEIFTDPDITEIRGAIDDAYDLLSVCASHYSTDDAGHFTTDDASHDSTVEAAHFSGDDATHYTTDDSSNDSSVDATHYASDDSSAFATHYAAANSGRKSYYLTAAKSIYNGSAK